VGLLIATIVGLPIFALIYPPAAISRLLHGWILGTSVTGILVLLGLIGGFELFVSPRWWCRVMCPGGALYGLIGWPRLWRVKLDADRCTNCGECEPVCEPGLDPVLESDGIECDNCGACIRRCPERALRFTVAPPTLKTTNARSEGVSPDGVSSAKTSKAAKVLTVLAVVLLIPATAHAHHILGLPHYSYKENYPQAPVLEYPATAGPYNILLQSYPGKPNPGEQVNLVFDITNTKTGKRYGQPVKIRVLQTFTFGENREIFSATKEQLGDVLYKVYPTFPEEGEYVVELTIDIDGKEEVIGFLMVVGNPSPATSILVTVIGALAVFLITVRAIKKKRQRRKLSQATTQQPEPENVPTT
jgi:NAD-dependent dihydropyrimidine dehydrogenase PreA subunit